MYKSGCSQIQYYHPEINASQLHRKLSQSEEFNLKFMRLFLEIKMLLISMRNNGNDMELSKKINSVRLKYFKFKFIV
jgi:hypothetical protein